MDKRQNLTGIYGGDQAIQVMGENQKGDLEWKRKNGTRFCLYL